MKSISLFYSRRVLARCGPILSLKQWKTFRNLRKDYEKWFRIGRNLVVNYVTKVVIFRNLRYDFRNRPRPDYDYDYEMKMAS